MKSVDATTVRRELMKLIEAGEPVAITRYGKVVATLRPGAHDDVRPDPTLAPDFPHAGGIEAVNATHGAPGGISASTWHATLAEVQAAQRRRDELLNQVNSSKRRK